MESLLDDEHKQYWDEHDKRRYVNQAVRTCTLWVARANEFLFLESGVITIDQDAVDDETLFFPLPDRTFYLSHYLSRYSDSQTDYFDFRPLWVPGAGDSCRLHLLRDYRVGLPNVIFAGPFTSTGEVQIWVKKLHPRITQNSGTINVPDVMFDFLLEMSLFYAHRKDEIPEEQTNLTLHRDQCLDILKTQEGFPETMGYNWDNLPDSGDL